MNKEKENPLKDYTKEELLKFYSDLEELSDLHLEVSENANSTHQRGVLTNDGIGIVRAFYVCLLKFYEEHKIPVPEGIELKVPDECRADFSSLVESYMEKDNDYDLESDADICYYQVEGVGYPIITDIAKLSEADGIGDFRAVNGAETYLGYVMPSTVLGDVFGEDWERIAASDSELSEEEKAGLDAPVEIAQMLAEAEDALDNYINNICDIRVICSKKIGTVLNRIKIPKTVSKETFLGCEPLLLKFLEAVDAINIMQQYYLSPFCEDVIRDDTWYSATVCADTVDDMRVVTLFSRIPVLLGATWFVQEVADRVLDGRIVIPTVPVEEKTEEK